MLVIHRALRTSLGALALTVLLAACGGSGSSTSSVGTDSGSGGGSGSGTGTNGGTNQPPQIQGVATPSSVAVVTATNAN